MKTLKELLNNITKDALSITNHRKKASSFRSREEINKTIRCAIGISLHYSKFLGVTQQEVLNALEKNRTYWSLNYYQQYRFPRINKLDAIFINKEDFFNKFPSQKYICPSCNGLSTNPNICTTKLPSKTKSKICDWKSYGLFGCLGKGYSFIFKEEFLLHPIVYTIFKPAELK